MTRLSPPLSTAWVDVPDDLVEKYTSAGWVEAEKPKTTTRKRSSDTENDK